jgi:hypothetical protein
LDFVLTGVRTLRVRGKLTGFRLDIRLRLGGQMRPAALTLSVALIFSASAAFTEAKGEDLEETIAYLLSYVRTSNCTFIRNNKEHTPEEAADHIMKKYDHYKNKIKTPEDFIRLSATKSMMSGKPYMIRTEAGDTMTSAEWLTQALEEYRLAKSGAPKAVGVDIQGHLPCPDSYFHETKTFEKKIGDCSDPYKDCVLVTLRYPDINGSAPRASKDSVNAFVRAFTLKSFSGEEMLTNPNKLADEFIGNYESVKKDFPDYTTGWFLERSVEVIHNTPEVLSLVSTETSYTGGAHPNSHSTYTSFDMALCEQIGLGDILTEGYEQKLNRVAEKRFREIKQLEPNQSLADAGFWFDDDNFALNDNFAICCDGLVFYFNAYEITSYAGGPTRLVIPYEDIKDIIRKDRKAWFEEG